MSDRSGYRNGQLIYPISIVDHKATTVDPVEEEVKEIKERLDAMESQHENVFYMGAGTSYTDVLNSAHMKPVNVSMKINADVVCENGDNIILVIESSFRKYFFRADMNGVEMGFTESTQTVDGVEYKVLTSENTYGAGTYNIDINS